MRKKFQVHSVCDSIQGERLLRENSIAKLFESIAKGERHIVRIKTETVLKGSLAIQFKLLQALKNETLDEHDLVNMLLIAGLAEVSKTLLKELLSVKGVTYDMLKGLFDDFGKAI